MAAIITRSNAEELSVLQDSSLRTFAQIGMINYFTKGDMRSPRQVQRHAFHPEPVQERVRVLFILLFTKMLVFLNRRKRHEVPAPHKAEQYLDAYLKAAAIIGDKKCFIFRSVDKTWRRRTENSMTRVDVLRMIERRADAAGLPYSTCCYSWWTTGMIAFLENAGVIEKAQAIAVHESPRNETSRTHPERAHA